jgi:16S rRNA processing protein RimM
MRVIVGRVGRPHGIRGELVIGIRTDEPDLRFVVGAGLDASSDSDNQTPADSTRLTIASRRWHSGQLLVAFTGITDRTVAGELTGSWLSIDSSQLPDTPDPDEFRDHELIGLSVHTTDGAEAGVVTDVLHHGQDLLVVRRDDGRGQEFLVPFVKAIVPEVDVAAGQLVIDPPPGLLDPAGLDSAGFDPAEAE